MMMLIANDPFIEVVTPSLRHRLTALLRSHHLDVELARGADPDSTVLRALRAQQLTRGKRRRMMAEALRRSLQVTPPLAQTRGARTTSTAQRAAVLAAEHELRDLVVALERPGPVTARGMALVSLLVTEGGGPLHYGGNHRLLRNRCRAAVFHLTPQ